MTLTIEIDDETAGLLGVLGDSPQSVAEYLIHSIADGVRRPGSWERQVLYPLFGDDFEAKLVTGDQPWRQKRA